MARDRILERRARFISTAMLLAAGCSREQSSPTKLPDTEVKATDASTPPPAVKPASVKPPPDRPSLDAKVSDAGVTRRDGALEMINKAYGATEKLASSVPAPCTLDHPECKEKLAKFLDEWARIEDELHGFYPRCPAKLPDDIAVDKMLSAHAAWLREWLTSIENAAKSTVGDAGTDWEKLRNDAINAHPQPCLKYYCP